MLMVEAVKRPSAPKQLGVWGRRCKPPRAKASFKEFLLGGQSACDKMEREAFLLGRQAKDEQLGGFGGPQGGPGAQPLEILEFSLFLTLQNCYFGCYFGCFEQFEQG